MHTIISEPFFEWDETKNALNIRKHGVDFCDVALIFENEIVEAVDDRSDYGELRYTAFGQSGIGVLRVVYTRRGDHIRIISAWKAGTMTRKSTIARYSLGEIKKRVAQGKSRSRRKAPAGVEEDEAFWKRAKVVVPTGKTSVHLRVDNDVFAWFKKRGVGHLTRMNAVLRSYVEMQRDH